MLLTASQAMLLAASQAAGRRQQIASRPVSQVLPTYDELYPKPRSTTSVTLRPVEDPKGALQVDLEAAPDNLRRVAEARADEHRDIVLMTSDSNQLDIAANLVANLAAVGVHHYVLIGKDGRTCSRVTKTLACVWSTLLEPRHTNRLRSAGTNEVRALWLVRQMYVGRLARLGYNPMMLDADVVVFRNPFELIRRHLPGYQVYALGDTSAGYMSSNAGTLYVRGSECGDPGNPAQRIWLEFERRVFDLLNASRPYPKQAARKVGPRDARRTIRGGRPADALLYDQNVLDWNMLGVMLNDYEFVGRGFSPTQRSLSDAEKEALKYKEYAASAPTPAGMGLPGWPYLARYEMREVALPRAGQSREQAEALPPHAKVRMLKAPPWLFSAESDEYQKKRVTAEHWHVFPPPQALIHFVCSRWPGSDGRKVEMKLLGKWFTPDVRHVTADTGAATAVAAAAAAAAPPRLIAFATPVRLTLRDDFPFGAKRPSVDHVLPWSQLLGVLAVDTQRRAVLPLFECAGVMSVTSRHVWTLTAADGRRAGPRKAACAYRVGQRCFGKLAYPEDVAMTPPPQRRVVELTPDALARDGVQGLVREVRAALSSARGRSGGGPAAPAAAQPTAAQPTALLIDVSRLATNLSAEGLTRHLSTLFRTPARRPWASLEASLSTRRLQELKMIRRWERQAARNATDALEAEAGDDLQGGRAGRRGRGRGRGGRGKAERKLGLLKDAEGDADFAARRAKGGRGGRGGRGVDKYRGYAPGPQTAGLGKWGSRLAEHNCYEGFLAKPSRQPYVC